MNKNKNYIIFGIFAAILAVLVLKGKKIVMKFYELGKKFQGIKDTNNNKAFTNKEFQKMMSAVGWEPGYQWCALFSKLLYTLAYKNDVNALKEIKTLFSPSSQRTFNNFRDKGKIFKGVTTGTAYPGDVIVFVHTNDRTKGHTGIILKLNEDGTADTIEGNTGDKSIGNGEYVAFKKRKYKIGANIGDDLIVRGYIKKV